MRLDQLFEMPIAIQHVELDDEGWRPSSFRDDDRKIINSPKARAKISKIFSASSCDLNLILLDVKQERDEALMNALYGTDDYKEWILKQVEDKISNSAINIVFTNNEGSERFPLTGWMIAHRAFHALVTPDSETARRISSQHKGVIFDLANNYNYEIEPRYIAAAFGASRACRMQNLTAASEIVPEAFAQFLLTGSVRFRELPPFVEVGHRKFHCIQGNIDFCNREVKNFEKFLNENFSILIKASVGKVFQI